MKLLTFQIPGNNGPQEITPPPNILSGPSAPGDIINFFLALLVTVGIVASLIFVLYGGVLWVTSQGDKAKIDRARRTITYAIVGLIIIILSFTITRTIGFVLGQSALSDIGK